MKQTAVEWLISELRKPYGDARINEILEKAKEMEKEQILIAYDNKWETGSYNPQQYYNETFNR